MNLNKINGISGGALMNKYELTLDQLTKKCDDDCLHFKTTADLTPLQGIIGQGKAYKAIEFGLSIKKKGYNIYISGSWGTGRKSYAKLITEKKAMNMRVPYDWVYVNNFSKLNEPLAISFDPGTAKFFVSNLERTIGFLRKEVEKVFSSRDYENARNKVYQEYLYNTEVIIEKLNVIGDKYGFKFSQNERGLVTIPLKDDKEPMSEDEYNNLTNEEYEELKNKSNKLSIETIDLFNKLRQEELNYRQRLKNIDEQMGRSVVTFHIANIRESFKNNEGLQAYLDSVVEDIVNNIEKFKGNQTQEAANPFVAQKNPEAFFDRYKVNLFIDNSGADKAPVVFETNPSLYNLVGSIEYKNEYGVMKTDFTQIKPGALHQANGGFLILQAKDLLSSPYSWKAVKRALMNQHVAIENLGKEMGLIVSQTLKPNPIPLDIKVIIVGDQYTYNLLYHYDEEFRKLFKIMANFDSEMPRNEDNMNKMARFIATHCIKENLKHFDKSAVYRIIEYATRLADNQGKLSSHLNNLVEVLYEADSWAEVYGDGVVTAEHVEKSLEEKMNRANMYEEKVLEMFKDEIYLIDVDGEKVGEINGLAVTGTGQHRFGKPSKITVSTYRGKSGIVNIEREARTSGKIHDKGVMILTGYLGHQYAQDKPLALTASVVFEQLYSGVDGDSASSTELYAILSSLADKPIKQNIAVTGSVNQRGEIQPIGGVNEKIEGFFKVCKLKGLTGDQGVMIPHQNVRNLMLNKEVRDAVEEGKFHVYSVETIDQGIEILTGVKAGRIQKNGLYTKNSIHYLVNEKLNELAKPLPVSIKNEEDSKGKHVEIAGLPEEAKGKK